MGKRIRIVPVLILLMFAVVGCGRQGKVSERKYIAALEAFEDYYKDELQDTYEELAARICMDAAGMPLMYVIATDQPEGYDTVYDYMVFACVKGEVTPVMEFSGLDAAKEGGIGIALYTDGIISVEQWCSERREEYSDYYGDYYEEYIEKEQTWYQIRGDKCTEIARRDLIDSISAGGIERVHEEGEEIEDEQEQEYEREIETNPGEIRFILGKKEYAFDLYGDDIKERDKLYKKVCNNLYSKNARGSKACQLWWKEELVKNEELPYLFMQSLPYSNNLCYDAKSFRRQISDLKKQGSKSGDEFLIWDIDEDTKKGYGVGRDAYYLMYRDPLLLNETGLIKKWDEDESYHQTVLDQLITYVMATGDYRIIEQLDFIDTISLKTMKKQAGQHLQYYLTWQDEEDWKVSQIASDSENEKLSEAWFDKAVEDLLKENLKGENSADYLKTYIKYLAKKKESILDEFNSQEMILSAYEYVCKKGGDLQGTGFVLAQLGEKDELCLLTDQGILTYDCGSVHTYHFDDSETFYWNEQTKELLFVDRDYNASGPWNENDTSERGLFAWDRIDTWLYHFRSVEDGKLTATCDYYMDYDNEVAYFRDWQEGYNPKYVQMDWEECRDSLWQRRCGNAYEKSSMEKEQLDRETPCFSERLDTDTGKTIQSNVLLYATVEEACEKFPKSGKANIEVREPVEKQEETVDDAVKKDAYIYALKHDPKIAEELGVNQNTGALKYTFLRVGENRELCLVVARDDSWYIATLLTYRDGKAALGRQMAYAYGRGMCYWNEETGYLYESTGGSGGYYDIVWTVTDGVEYTVRRGEYEEIYPIGETLEYNYFLSGNDEPIIEGGGSLSSSIMSEEEKEVLKVRKVTEQDYNSAFLEANKGLTSDQMYRVEIERYSGDALQFFDTIEKAYEAIQKDPSANCVKAPPLEEPSLEEEQLSPEAAPALSEIDVEAEVAQIRNWFTETQSHLSEYDLEIPEVGVERYVSENGLVKLVFEKGYGGRRYERDYYYHDGELYFAFLFDGGEEHRLYFSYGTLIRYIDANKNTYDTCDYGDTEAFDDWAEWVTEEAEEYY